MASYSSLFVFLFHSFLFLSISNAQPSSTSRPGGLAFTVSRDPSTLQYVTNISLGKIPTNLVLDLGASRSWIYSSRGCASKQISSVVTARPNYLKDRVWVSGPNVTASGISFGCETTTGALRGLAKGANGIAALGRSGLSLASQFSAAFGFPQKVTLRLNSGEGDMYFGDGPYTYTDIPFMHPSFYTPLIANSYFPSEYFVGVKSMAIDGVNVALNTGLLSINKSNGVGGTKFSPSVPYTTMETSIFKAFSSAYIQIAKSSYGTYVAKQNKYTGISMVAPVAPFSVCFNESTIERRIDGPVLPKIRIGFNNADWDLYGYGSTLTCVKKDVCCLAFVDGGSKPKTSIVIGAYQMHSHTIEFDIAKSRLGISSPYQL